MHYYHCNKTVETTDFNLWWRHQEPCVRDGASLGKIQSIATYLGNSKLSTNQKVNQRAFSKALSMRLVPSKYETLVVDCGIVKWCCERQVSRIINHHRTTVTERKYYKTRPKTTLKGGVIKAVHLYIYSFDAREYDPLEHC